MRSRRGEDSLASLSRHGHTELPWSWKNGWTLNIANTSPVWQPSLMRIKPVISSQVHVKATDLGELQWDGCWFCDGRAGVSQRERRWTSQLGLGTLVTQVRSRPDRQLLTEIYWNVDNMTKCDEMWLIIFLFGPARSNVMLCNWWVSPSGGLADLHSRGRRTHKYVHVLHLTLSKRLYSKPTPH